MYQVGKRMLLFTRSCEWLEVVRCELRKELERAVCCELKLISMGYLYSVSAVILITIS